LNDAPELMTATLNLELPPEKFEFNLPNLFIIKSVPFLDVKKTLLKIGMLSQQAETRFYQKISQNLILKEQKPQEIAVQVDSNTIILQKEEEQQAAPKSSIQSIKCLKYFINTSLKSEADLQNAETQVKIKIKILSERILVETMTLQITPQVLSELSKLDEFERNLFLCHLSQHQAFASFEFPRNFAEIFEEFTWIHNNIKTYLEILQALSPQTFPQPVVAPPQILENDHLESLDELIFCKSYDLNVPPTGQTAILPLDTNLKKNMHQLHNLFPADDDVVESLASSFYLVFSQETPAPLTGLLILWMLWLEKDSDQEVRKNFGDLPLCVFLKMVGKENSFLKIL